MLDNLVWIILLIALAGFAAFIPKFLQIGIFLNILEQSTFVGIIAVGLSLTLIAGQMDLSIESVMALAAMSVALTFGTGGAGGGLALDPAWLAFPVSLAMALGIGAAIGAAERRPGGALRDQRLHRDARLLHLGPRPRGRDVGRPLGLRPARRASHHGDRPGSSASRCWRWC